MRNYTPEDEDLKDRQVPKAKPASGEDTRPGEKHPGDEAELMTLYYRTFCAVLILTTSDVLKYLALNDFSVEDKVKDQLDAANPEPIIEEVVGTLWYHLFVLVLSIVCY